jgi:hypothetical protein
LFFKLKHPTWASIQGAKGLLHINSNLRRNSTFLIYACRDNDTACTIDERFERPWQPLKVISNKNILKNKRESKIDFAKYRRNFVSKLSQNFVNCEVKNKHTQSAGLCQAPVLLKCLQGLNHGKEGSLMMNTE